MKKLLLFIILAISFVSCKKEELKPVTSEVTLTLQTARKISILDHGLKRKKVLDVGHLLSIVYQK